MKVNTIIATSAFGAAFAVVNGSNPKVNNLGLRTFGGVLLCVTVGVVAILWPLLKSHQPRSDARRSSR